MLTKNFPHLMKMLVTHWQPSLTPVYCRVKPTPLMLLTLGPPKPIFFGFLPSVEVEQTEESLSALQLWWLTLPQILMWYAFCCGLSTTIFHVLKQFRYNNCKLSRRKFRNCLFHVYRLLYTMLGMLFLPVCYRVCFCLSCRKLTFCWKITVSVRPTEKQ